MVAEASPSSAVLEAPRKLRIKARDIDVRTAATIRTLYLVQGLAPIEIERMGIGVTANQVSQLAYREGWTKQKMASISKAEETARACSDAAVQKVAEALAVEGEELCFKALTQTRAGLDKGGLDGAKQAQAASSALRNLHSVVQAIRKPTEASSDGSTQVNVFLLRAGDVAPAEPKQVTEVTTKTVQ